MIITIDTGTTNTRIKLFDQTKMVYDTKVNVGVRDTAISGSTMKLKDSIKGGLENLLRSFCIRESDVECVLASGMIGSNVGLLDVPHVTTPADIRKIAQNIRRVSLPDITNIPFIFIPGVKNSCDYSSISDIDVMDIMRGEETELVGIIDIKNIKGPLIAVLPGSHTKIVEVNENNEITACHTTMGGEIIDAVSKNTIIKSSLPEKLMEFIDEEYLTMGFEYSRVHGFNKASFRIRLMQMFPKIQGNKLANFFIGAVLADDICLIEKIVNQYRKGPKIIVGGPNHLRQAFALLARRVLKEEMHIVELSDDEVNMCTSIGALKIYKETCV